MLQKYLLGITWLKLLQEVSLRYSLWLWMIMYIGLLGASEIVAVLFGMES
jgi:hypothetical protein